MVASRAKPPAWFCALAPRVFERAAKTHGTPLYVYDAATLRARCRALRAAFPRAQIRYAMKANSNPALLALVREEGLGVDTVSPWEVRLAREVGFKKHEIIYSGNNPSDEELSVVHRAGVTLNVDALSTLDRLGRLAPGAAVSLRLNLEIGGGHHPHVVTAGPESKFGLAREDLPRAFAIARRYGLRIVGLHQHIGSGIFDLNLFVSALEPFFSLASEVPGLEFVDVGGGFGVPYRLEEAPIDLPAWGAAIGARFESLERALGRKLGLLIEPGRYVVAEAGALLTRVTTLKRTRDRTFVGVDAGMHHLVRPAMYGSYHEVFALNPREGKRERCFIVGPICESGDVLAEERSMVPPEEGDLLIVGDAGAYGYAMASQYNLRPRPAEVLFEGARARLIRERERYRDVVRRRDRALR